MSTNKSNVHRSPNTQTHKQEEKEERDDNCQMQTHFTDIIIHPHCRGGLYDEKYSYASTPEIIKTVFL